MTLISKSPEKGVVNMTQQTTPTPRARATLTLHEALGV